MTPTWPWPWSGADSMDEAKKRALQFITETNIEGQDSSGNAILTNLDYLRNHLDQLLTF